MDAALLVTQGADPTRRVAGLTLWERARLTMKHVGAERTWLVASGPDQARALEAALGPEAAGAVSTRQELEARLLEAPRNRPWLVGPAAHVHDKSTGALVERARRADPPAVLLADAQGQRAQLAVIDGLELLRRLERVAPGGELEPIFDLDRQTLELTDPERAFIDVPVADAAGAERAEDALWDSCRKDIDGFVSRHLNRHISLAISRRIVDWPIRPNHVTALCIALGLASGAFAAQGTWAGIATGALLLQANSVLDGVDGELARVRWEFSRLGELLDSVGDNVANFSFFGALTWTMFARGADTIGMIGVACLMMWMSYVGFLYAQLWRMGRGDVLMVRQNIDVVARGWLAQLIHLLRTVILRRDGYVFLILLLSLAGLHEPLIMVMCAGAAIPFMGMIIHYALQLGRVVAPGESRARTEG